MAKLVLLRLTVGRCRRILLLLAVAAVALLLLIRAVVAVTLAAVVVVAGHCACTWLCGQVVGVHSKKGAQLLIWVAGEGRQRHADG